MRFPCFLLGSALLHAAFLALPLSTSTGDAGRNAPELLRVRLLDSGSPRRAAVNVKRPRQPALRAQGPADGAARAERPKLRTRRAPKTESVRTRAGASPVARAVPLAPVRATLRTSMAAAPAPEAPDVPGQDRGRTGSVQGPPGEAPGREREPSASPAGGETALARAPDRERRQGPRATPGRAAAAARTPVRYARVVKPKYPRKARTAGWEGTTVLKVRVDPGGRPGLVTVDRTSGFELLDRAAMRAMRQWEFHPARNGDRTVASWVKVPVSFQLKEEDRP